MACIYSTFLEFTISTACQKMLLFLMLLQKRKEMRYSTKYCIFCARVICNKNHCYISYTSSRYLFQIACTRLATFYELNLSRYTCTRTLARTDEMRDKVDSVQKCESFDGNAIASPRDRESCFLKRQKDSTKICPPESLIAKRTASPMGVSHKWISLTTYTKHPKLTESMKAYTTKKKGLMKAEHHLKTWCD